MKPIHYLDTQAIKAQYDELGVVLVEGLYTEEDMSEIEAFFEDFKNAEAIFDGSNNYSEISKADRQVRALQPHRFSDKVKEWFLEPRVAQLLEVLLEKPPLGAQTMYYYKPPGARGQGMHQDNYPLHAAPAACIATWTPVDDADEENGCLQVSIGSHKLELLCPTGKLATTHKEYGDTHITEFPKGMKPVPIPTKRGQTLIFHGLTIHGSGPNRTKDRYRRVLTGHYVDSATEKLAAFYHPIINMQGETVSNIEVATVGGLCG